jgi:hypothetical protein
MRLGMAAPRYLGDDSAEEKVGHWGSYRPPGPAHAQNLTDEATPKGR